MANITTKATIKIDNAQRISKCGKDIDDSIDESEELEELTQSQKLEISNIIYMNLLATFDELNIEMVEV
jgi:hypothetical protein